MICCCKVVIIQLMVRKGPLVIVGRRVFLGVPVLAELVFNRENRALNFAHPHLILSESLFNLQIEPRILRFDSFPFWQVISIVVRILKLLQALRFSNFSSKP